MPKYQYYQDDDFMKIQILEPMVQREHLDVTFSRDKLSVKVKKEEESKGLMEYTVIRGGLYDEVVVDKCKYVIKDEKVLIKLKKKDSVHWEALLDDKRSRDRQKSRAKSVGEAVDITATNVNNDHGMINATNEQISRPMLKILQDITSEHHHVMGCKHVSEHPDPDHYGSFVKTYFEELSKASIGECSNNTSPLTLALKATRSTLMKNYPVDQIKQKQIIDYFVMIGANSLISNCDLWTARISATVIATLEGEKKGQDLLKYGDVIGGCSRSLFKFYIDRIVCTCLDEKYKNLKAEKPKTGLCQHCVRRTERSKLFVCSQCNEAQYCSRKCQIADTKHGCLRKKSV